MASLPYMQLYVSDYLADTFHLSTEEHGAYLLMLMNYWQTGKPLQCKRIPSVVRMTSQRFAEAEEVLAELFEIDENGFWIHKRIEKDLKKVHEKSAKAKENAQKRWDAKAQKQGGECNSNANAKQTQSHKDKDKDKDKDKEYIKEIKEKHPDLNIEAFELWLKYKGGSYTKQGKTLSKNKLLKVNKEIQMLMVENSIMNNYKGLFDIKSPSMVETIKKGPQVGSLEWERLEAIKKESGITDAELI